MFIVSQTVLWDLLMSFSCLLSYFGILYLVHSIPRCRINILHTYTPTYNIYVCINTYTWIYECIYVIDKYILYIELYFLYLKILVMNQFCSLLIVCASLTILFNILFSIFFFACLFFLFRILLVECWMTLFYLFLKLLCMFSVFLFLLLLSGNFLRFILQITNISSYMFNLLSTPILIIFNFRDKILYVYVFYFY